MLESKSYQVIFNDIEKQHPGLVSELTLDKVVEEQRQYFTLGTFCQFAPEDRYKWGEFRIFIRSDHENSNDDEKISACLAHEYGHYTMRTQVYPNLGQFGKRCMEMMEVRYTLGRDLTKWAYSLRLLTVCEEYAAWFIGFALLKKHNLLNFSRIKYGFKCASTYLHRLRFWI